MYPQYNSNIRIQCLQGSLAMEVLAIGCICWVSIHKLLANEKTTQKLVSRSSSKSLCSFSPDFEELPLTEICSAENVITELKSFSAAFAGSLCSFTCA